MARVPHRTFYDVLGISQDANHDAIKLAYKKMSRRCHPDKNPGNAHAVTWQQEVNKAYETLRDTTSRVAYDSKLPSQRKIPNPFTPQYTWNSFDGAWGMPSSGHWQPSGNYHYGQRPTTDDYWGGTGPWHESPTYDSKDSRENQRPEKDQAWDFNNWHESQPSEPGSFSWTENEELWKQAEEERRKAEKERQDRVDAERRMRREKKRAKREKEQKRINDARIPAQQKKLSEQITALDEAIARLKAVSRRSALPSETEDGCRTDGKGTDTVDHFAIKLNRRTKLLGEALYIYHRLCRTQRSNGEADEAEDAERKLAKAREDLVLRLADEFVREEEEQRAGFASLHEERLRIQHQRHQTDQEKEPELQEQYDWNNALSGNQKPNGSRAAVEHSDAKEIRSGERNVYGLSSKPPGQTDIGANPVPMKLRCRRIYDWLDQLVDDDEEETEAPDGDIVKNPEHPHDQSRPTQASRHPVHENSKTPVSNQKPYSTSQASHNIIDSEPEPLIPDLSRYPSPIHASHESVNSEHDLHPDQNPSFQWDCLSPVDSKPRPLRPSPNTDPLESDNETFISDYLQTVHNNHLEVHGEFWDFVADDEVNCDFCRRVLPVLQCPKCNLRACSECKTHRGKRSCDNMWEWR